MQVPSLASSPSTGTLVESLPGYGSLTSLGFRLLSGTVTASPQGQHPVRTLFYAIAESQRSPATDPVVLWQTGGPGCSGISAFWWEHGPFTMAAPQNINNPEGFPSITLNPFSWNRVATVIYMDSPWWVVL